MSRRLPIAPRIFGSDACSRNRTNVRSARTSWKEYTARGVAEISGASSGPVRGLRQWRSWLTVAPESAAAIFVAYATSLPFSAYAYHALCPMTYAVPHRTRRVPGNERPPGGESGFTGRHYNAAAFTDSSQQQIST